MCASPKQPGLSLPDQEEVKAAARRFFEAGLCCVVEVERDHGTVDAWEPQLLAFRSSTPERLLEAVEETAARYPSGRVRVVGYDSASLTPAAGTSPVVRAPSRTELPELQPDVVG